MGSDPPIERPYDKMAVERVKSDYDEMALQDPLLSRVLKWRLNGADGFIIAEVFFNECYDELRPLREGEVVVDAGAHIGTFTLKSSLKVGDAGKVHAFEPERENLKYLSFNIKGLKNVELHDVALWSSEGTKTLYHNKGNTGGHSLFTDRWRRPVYEVETVQLDSVVTDDVDFIKIDVEGSELEVLRGAKRILEYCSPYIAMEIHTMKLVDDVTSFLSDYGYTGSAGTGAYVFEVKE